MKNFFEEIKKKLIEIAKDKSYFEPSGYYETVMQNRDNLANILEDCTQYDFQLSYRYDPEEYSYGFIRIHLYGESKHFYELELCNEERHWGYCQCQIDDEGYDGKHGCCGENCDWNAPQIYITKHIYESSFTFNGLEKDLWKIHDKWEDENKETKELNKKRRLLALQEQIEEIQCQMREIESQ